LNTKKRREADSVLSNGQCQSIRWNVSRFTTNFPSWKGAQSSYGRLVFPSVPVL